MKPTVSVLIPWRPHPTYRDREPLLRWVLKRWNRILESEPHEILYGTGPVRGPFNRAAAINTASHGALADTFIIADADTTVPVPEQIADALRAVRSAPVWSLPYTAYFNLTKEWTGDLLALDPTTPTLPQPATWEHRLTDSVSGIVVCSREAFKRVNGFDEGFVGWGGEDRAFAASLTMLYGPVTRWHGSCLHLWHEDTVRSGNPNWPANERRQRRYLDATTIEEMERVRFGR